MMLLSVDIQGSKLLDICNCPLEEQEPGILIHISGAFFIRNATGDKFTFSSDADLIYQFYRNNCFHRLREFIDGSYRAIIVDKKRSCFLASSDPYGLNKIYYRPEADNFIVSSNVTSICEKLSDSLIDRKGLCEYLRFLDISPPRTIIEGIRELEPGSVLYVSLADGEWRIETYGKSAGETVSRLDGLDRCISELQSLLTESVYQRIAGSNKTGLLLSGGIDSGLLAAVSSRLNNGGSLPPVVAYTVGFESRILDESRIASAVADHLGISHIILTFDIAEELRAFEDLVNRMEFPFADPATVPTVLALNRMRRDGVDTVMEGTGADGAIGYMPSRFHNIVVNGTSRIPSWIRYGISGLLRIGGDPLGLLAYFDFQDPQEKFIRWKGWSRKEIRDLCGLDCSFENSAFYKCYEENKNDGIYELYRNLMCSMPDDRIVQTLRIYGFTPAFPFWDQEVRRFIEALPQDYKYQHGKNKLIYKMLLERFVPRDMWDVPKHGFDYPFERLLQYSDFALIRTYLSEESLKFHGLFDMNEVNKYIDRFMAGDMSVKFKIWALVVFQAWFIKNQQFHK